MTTARKTALFDAGGRFQLDVDVPKSTESALQPTVAEGGTSNLKKY